MVVCYSLRGDMWTLIWLVTIVEFVCQYSLFGSEVLVCCGLTEARCGLGVLWQRFSLNWENGHVPLMNFMCYT